MTEPDAQAARAAEHLADAAVVQQAAEASGFTGEWDASIGEILVLPEVAQAVEAAYLASLDTAAEEVAYTALRGNQDH
jgi:NAD(P)H-dependent flavin oxidoreductase YrpB (nitropropane dioxygenase family)